MPKDGTTTKERGKNAATKADPPISKGLAANEARAIERLRERRKRAPTAKDAAPGGVECGEGTPAGWSCRIAETCGTGSFAFSDNLMSDTARALGERGKPTMADQVTLALAGIHGIGPQNETEAMLAGQMVGTHSLSMEMLRRAKHTDRADHIETYGNLAVKLMRTYTAQIEALAKLRRGGEQTVRVEHVHVYSGGQAIVGAVTHGGGGGRENSNQPHAPADLAALAYVPGVPMWGQDAGGDAMPSASGKGQEPVPDARRISRKRSPKGRG